MWYMTEEREMLVKMLREFAEKEIRPAVPEMEKGAYPRELLKKLGQLGLLGLVVGEEYGGSGEDWISYGLMLEEFAKVSSTFALLTDLSSDITIGLIHKYCTPEQVEMFVKPALRGDILLSFYSTEPCGIFNVSEYETRAVLDGDEWVINGGKIFSTNSDVADVNIIACVTADKVDPVTQEGISWFAIPASDPGYSVGHIENKLGWKGSHTGQVYLNDCRVPRNYQIGPLNKGVPLLTANLVPGYCAYGAFALGSMEAVFAKTKGYLQGRIQGGKSLWDTHQVIRNDMANMWILIENFRGAVFSALENRNRGENIFNQAIGLKVEGEKLMEHVASQCIELHGGVGTVYETGIERFYRDAKMLSVGCGSNKTLVDLLSYFI